MDSGTCRSGRTGSAPRDETFGYARGLEEGQRLRGEMRQPLRGKKRVRRNTERGVMVETPPASPFKVIVARWSSQASQATRLVLQTNKRKRNGNLWRATSPREVTAARAEPP